MTARSNVRAERRVLALAVALLVAALGCGGGPEDPRCPIGDVSAAPEVDGVGRPPTVALRAHTSMSFANSTV